MTPARHRVGVLASAMIAVALVTCAQCSNDPATPKGSSETFEARPGEEKTVHVLYNYPRNLGGATLIFDGDGRGKAVGFSFKTATGITSHALDIGEEIDIKGWHVRVVGLEGETAIFAITTPAGEEL